MQKVGDREARRATGGTCEGCRRIPERRPGRPAGPVERITISVLRLTTLMDVFCDFTAVEKFTPTSYEPKRNQSQTPACPEGSLRAAWWITRPEASAPPLPFHEPGMALSRLSPRTASTDV